MAIRLFMLLYPPWELTIVIWGSLLLSIGELPEQIPDVVEHSSTEGKVSFWPQLWQSQLIFHQMYLQRLGQELASHKLPQLHTIAPLTRPPPQEPAIALPPPSQPSPVPKPAGKYAKNKMLEYVKTIRKLMLQLEKAKTREREVVNHNWHEYILIIHVPDPQKCTRNPF